MNLDFAGITVVDGPQDLNRYRGRLDLPPDFDSKRWACKWVKKGVGVERALQPTHILGTNLRAPGWALYKNPKTGIIWTRALKDGIYVLMVQPQVTRKAILAVNGNTSRKRMVREANNETIKGEDFSDTGMLPSDTLTRAGLGTEDMAPMKVEYNQIDQEKATSAPVVARASTRATVSSKLKSNQNR